jgi:hypothetical protein
LGALFLWLERAANDLRKMGFEAGTNNFFQTVRTNWRQVFTSKFYKNRSEWTNRVRIMSLPRTDLNSCGPALLRFRPSEVLLGFCGKLEDVSVLRNLPDLERLDFYKCSKVKDCEIVSSFAKLRELTFFDNPALQSLAIIKSGAKLTSLHIWECRNLTDLDELRHLTSLRSLYLWNRDRTSVSPLPRERAPGLPDFGSSQPFQERNPDAAWRFPSHVREARHHSIPKANAVKVMTNHWLEVCAALRDALVIESVTQA